VVISIFTRTAAVWVVRVGARVHFDLHGPVIVTGPAEVALAASSGCARPAMIRQALWSLRDHSACVITHPVTVLVLIFTRAVRVERTVLT
jgi:hypothetical protein